MNLGILLDPWIWTDNMNSAVAHPGFTWGGRTPTPKVGVLTYFFCQKLHENEIFWTGGGRVPGASLNPPVLVNEFWAWENLYFGGIWVMYLLACWISSTWFIFWFFALSMYMYFLFHHYLRCDLLCFQFIIFKEYTENSFVCCLGIVTQCMSSKQKKSQYICVHSPMMKIRLNPLLYPEFLTNFFRHFDLTESLDIS